MPRGTDILQAAADRYRDERHQQHLTQRCSRCTWTISGLLLDTKVAFAAHLSEHHPEVKVVARRPRRMTRMPKITDKSLDQNIADARAQGASGWAGPPEL
jgi:pterin-4a-carbinolamine dehydratase